MKTQEKKQVPKQRESLKKHEPRCFSRVSHTPAALLVADAMASRQEGIARFTCAQPSAKKQGEHGCSARERVMH